MGHGDVVQCNEVPDHVASDLDAAITYSHKMLKLSAGECLDRPSLFWILPIYLEDLPQSTSQHNG